MEQKTAALVEKLFDKYRLSGQNVDDYLEGLLVSNYEPYWKYIHLDSLLSLQNPKTDFRDETVFITYHQITELYFKLILHEIDHVQANAEDIQIFTNGIIRVNRYIENLISSFNVMTDGMDQEEFLKFRMALLPASGFQSGQFRMIEIALTPLNNLAEAEIRANMSDLPLEEVYNNIYWKHGAMDLASGEKTLTLRQFEMRYDKQFLEFAVKNKNTNFLAIYQRFKARGLEDMPLQTRLRTLDTNLNVNWRLAHYRSAVRYLNRADTAIEATGGTNWHKFLPPRFQRIISFPELWSDEEKENWGKSLVQEQIDKP